MSDRQVVADLERLVGRPLSHTMEGDICVSLALTDADLPVYGVLRHASAETKYQALLLVSRLRGLRELDLRQNWLRTLPAEMSALQELRFLDLASNYLGEVPDWIFDLARLEHLNLGVNELKGISPRIGNLEGLRALYIHKNAIAALPKEISALRNLGVLNLYLNRFPDYPKEMWSLPGIHTFAWGLCNVDYIPEEMSGWTQLRFITLVACKIADAGRLARNRELSGARLHKNVIERVHHDLCDMPKLRQVTLYQNDLTELPEEFGNLQALEMLNLSWNRFAAIPPSVFRLPKLRWLAMHDNPGIGAGPPVVTPFELVVERPFFSDKKPMWNRLDFM